MKLPNDFVIQGDTATLKKAIEIIEKNGFEKYGKLNVEKSTHLSIYSDNVYQLANHRFGGRYTRYTATPETIESIINEILQLSK
jgi:hypothetical protein